MSTLKKYDQLVGEMLKRQETFFDLRKTYPRDHPSVIDALNQSKKAEKAVKEFRVQLRQLFQA